MMTEFKKRAFELVADLEGNKSANSITVNVSVLSQIKSSENVS